METKRVAILISDKRAFKIKTVKRDKEGLSIMIKGSIQEEDITIINIHAPNIGAPQHIKHILYKAPQYIRYKLYMAIYKTNVNIYKKFWETLTPHLHQWTDHRDIKSIRKTRP